jgi:mannose-6-phosphate isomerase-like protein (cupin superfamily)
MIERVEVDGTVLAMILRNGPMEPGIHFFTPGDYSQQFGCMRHAAGHVIEPHVHNPVPRAVHFTHEVLFLRRGRLRVDFYTESKRYLESRMLSAGDVILLVAGGHGFQAVEEIEMVEVKQGPYVGDADKTRFSGISAGEARLAGPCTGETKKAS